MFQIHKKKYPTEYDAELLQLIADNNSRFTFRQRNAFASMKPPLSVRQRAWAEATLRGIDVPLPALNMVTNGLVPKELESGVSEKPAILRRLPLAPPGRAQKFREVK